MADGFEQVEMTSPRDALIRAGALVEIVSPQDRQVRGWQHTEWGETFAVDRPVVAVEATDYDALVLPGGQMSPTISVPTRRPSSWCASSTRPASRSPRSAMARGSWSKPDSSTACG